MKLAHAKFLITAILAAACFVLAMIIAAQMIWFDTQLDKHSNDAHGARRVEIARAYRHVTYQDLPAILFLTIAALFLGILAIRFYNHAKSEFSS